MKPTTPIQKDIAVFAFHCASGLPQSLTAEIKWIALIVVDCKWKMQIWQQYDYCGGLWDSRLFKNNDLTDRNAGWRFFCCSRKTCFLMPKHPLFLSTFCFLIRHNRYATHVGHNSAESNKNQSRVRPPLLQLLPCNHALSFFQLFWNRWREKAFGWLLFWEHRSVLWHNLFEKSYFVEAENIPWRVTTEHLRCYFHLIEL